MADPDLVVAGGLVLTAGRFVEADVSVAGGRISEIAGHLEPGEARVVDASGGAVLPGLVNAHMHETIDRGIFEDLAFEEWIRKAQAKDRAYEPRHERAAALLNQLEMIRGGTTSFIDIFRHPRQAAEVALSSGLRATFSPQVVDSPEGVGESLRSNLELVAELPSGAPSRLRAWFGPHSLYSCDPATFEQMADAARHFGVGIHTHLAESAFEVELVRRRHRTTPARLLDSLVGEVPHLLAAHFVQTDGDDLALAAERGWAVAHCPSSNMKLGNGAAPVSELLAAGVTVGLGTDSNMTNNNLDMFEEMRQAALVQKLLRKDATALDLETVFCMATAGSAAALGWGGEIGLLEPGYLADLIVVDLGRAHLWPAFEENLLAELVYSASAADVRTTIVEGAVLMEEGVVATIDEEMVDELVHAEAHDLLRKAGLGTDESSFRRYRRRGSRGSARRGS